MGINTDGLALGNSLPANASFQGRTPGSAASQVTDGQKTDGDYSSQADPAAGAAGQSCDGDSSSTGDTGSSTAGTGAAGTAGSAAAAKSTGPSAQTRNAQGTESRRNPRTTGARSSATTAADAQTNPAATDAGEDAGTDFGSVMATALGRGAGSTTGQPAQSKPAARGDSPGTTPGGPPAGTPPADAVAWIAQVLMPPGAPQATGTAATEGAVGLPGEPGAHNALTAQQSAAAAALRASGTADPLPQTAGTAADPAPAPGGDAQAAALSAPGAGNVNALATVQQLVSGLTGANPPDSDPAGAAGSPTAHATPADSGTDASQAVAALQLSLLSRPDAILGNTTLGIQSPVGSAAFADDVSSQVTGLAQSGITQAQLQLNPADLGPVQVHITLQSGQASVWFGAAHSDTRAALEQSLPRLREMFAGAGMPLADSGVFREPPQQQPAQPLPVPGGARTFAADTAPTATVTQVSNIRLALLDTYA